MHRSCLALAGLLLSALSLHAQESPIARFEMQQIESGLKVGYAVLLADLNEDGKLDIVVVDTTRVVWYENPTWKRRTIIEGQTRPDNVCITALDIDGDKHLDLVIGADWKPFNTKSGGTLQWLRRGKTLDEPWTMFPIGEEPTVHRVRTTDLDGDGKPEILLVPLMGRDSSKAANWMDGRPVRSLVYPIPADPVKGPWQPWVLDETLHVVHNFHPIPAASGKGMDVLMASYEGVSRVSRRPDGKWATQHIGTGNQDNPQANRGASEIKQGKLRSGTPVIATIEPWHGNQVVVYTPPEKGESLWTRQVIDARLRWGHAVWFADLDGDGGDELIIGVRDNPGPKDTGIDRRGVRIYHSLDGKSWQRQIVEDGGVAVEDLTAGDLDGDGRIDLVAVGRQTFNARIYWNRGK